MAKITSVKTNADNNKLFTAQVNDDNTREFKEYDITSGINNKSLSNTADVTSFDEGMDVITVNPTGDKFVGVDRRGRDVVNLSTTNNFSVNSFNLLSSFKVDRLVRGDVFGTVPPGLDPTFNPNTNNTVFTIRPLSNGNMLIGGRFTSVNGVTRNRMAMLDQDGNVLPFNPNIDTGNNVYSARILPNNNIVFGGLFSHVNGVGRNNIAMVDINGNILPFNPDANRDIYPIELTSDGNILLAGQFTSIGGVARNRIAMITQDGDVLPFNPNANNIINQICILSNGNILLGGWFTSVGGVSRNHIAMVDPNGNVLPFNPNANDIVRTMLELPNGNILLGGYFTNIGGVSRSRIAMVDPNGNVLPFNLGANDTVLSSQILSNGNILLGGMFTNIGGVSRSRIAMLDQDGNVLPFNYSVNGSYTFPLKELSNGDILFGGLFTTVNSISRNYIAKVNFGGESFISTTEIPFEAMGVTSDRLVKLNTSNNTSTATNDFTSVTISDGTNEVTILPNQINTQINANVLIGRSLTVTYNLTGNKDINTVLSEYNLTINK